MPEASRTVLAFDFGLKRIGVAVGETELRSAHPLPGIAAPGFAAIEKLVKEWRPDALVGAGVAWRPMPIDSFDPVFRGYTLPTSAQWTECYASVFERLGSFARPCFA